MAALTFMSQNKVSMHKKILFIYGCVICLFNFVQLSPAQRLGLLCFLHRLLSLTCSCSTPTWGVRWHVSTCSVYCKHEHKISTYLLGCESLFLHATLRPLSKNYMCWPGGISTNKRFGYHQTRKGTEIARYCIVSVDRYMLYSSTISLSFGE